jgi:hypothetical protein
MRQAQKPTIRSFPNAGPTPSSANFGVASNDLITVGYGKSKLKNPGAPMDPANRRVQVVNLANKTASK